MNRCSTLCESRVFPQLASCAAASSALVAELPVTQCRETPGSILNRVPHLAHSQYMIPPGWTSLTVLLLLIGGFIIFSTGVTGLYIGKIFSQVKGRPLYVVDTRVVGGVERPVTAAVKEPSEASIR